MEQCKRNYLLKRLEECPQRRNGVKPGSKTNTLTIMKTVYRARRRVSGRFVCGKKYNKNIYRFHNEHVVTVKKENTTILTYNSDCPLRRSDVRPWASCPQHTYLLLYTIV